METVTHDSFSAIVTNHPYAPHRRLIAEGMSAAHQRFYDQLASTTGIGPVLVPICVLSLFALGLLALVVVALKNDQQESQGEPTLKLATPGEDGTPDEAKPLSPRPRPSDGHPGMWSFDVTGQV